MHCAIDIGNSAAKFGLFRGSDLIDASRFVHDGKSSSAFAFALEEVLERAPVSRVSFCSVVPEIDAVVQAVLARRGQPPAITVTHRSTLPITLGYRDPIQIGNDRIAAAAALFAHVAPQRNVSGRALVAIDAGTAVTFNVVEPNGHFLGGLIWAGPDLVSRALHRGTALLPLAEPTSDDFVIADNTADAIGVAVSYGFIEGVSGILRRIAVHTGDKPFAVATGGRGAFAAGKIDEIDIYEPHLVLHGVRIIAEMNSESSRS